MTEITGTNRPKDVLFDWFLNPLLIIKDQIKAENLSEDEEVYLGQLVLLSGNANRLTSVYPGRPPESELKRAELDALARRLRGITKSISRYPTYRRRFESLTKTILEELDNKNCRSQSSSGSRTIRRTRSSVLRIVSQKSIKGKGSRSSSDLESIRARDRDEEIVTSIVEATL
ncbi:putative membrane protein [Drosera capensis]